MKMIKSNEDTRFSLEAFLKNNIVLSFIICSIFFATVMTIFPLRFEVNDDSMLMYVFAGYYTGTPRADAIFVYTTFGLIVSSLYMLLPLIPWYTVFMLAVMFVSTVIIVYVFLSQCKRNELPLILSIVAIILFLCLFVTRLIMYIHFTIVAGFAGSASIVLFFFFRPKDTIHNAINISAVALLFFLSISIRAETGQLVLAFLFCILLYKLVYYIKEYKTHLVTATAIIFVLISVILVENVYKSSEEWRNFEPHYQQYLRFADYPRISYAQFPEVYHAAGWSSVEFYLAHNWCYIFPQFNEESLSIINNASSEYFGSAFSLTRAGLYQFLRIFRGVMLSSNYIIAVYIAFMCIWGTSLLVAILNNKKIEQGELNFAFKKISWLRFLQNHRLFLTLGIIFLFHASCIYQIGLLRFTDRVFRMIIIVYAPLSIINLVSMIGTGKIIQAVKPKNVTKRILSIKILCSGLLVVIIGITIFTFTLFDMSRMSSPSQLESIKADLDSLAITNPENIYVNSTHAIGIANPFTVFTDQKPINVIFWGGVRYLSPLWNEHLRVLGRESLVLDDFWEDNIYLVTRHHFEMELLLSYFRISNPDSYFRLIEELPSGISVFTLVDSTAITEY